MEKDSGATTRMGCVSTSSDHQGMYILNRFVGICLYTYRSKSLWWRVLPFTSSLFLFRERIIMFILVLQNDAVVCSAWYWLLFCLQVLEV